MKYYELMRYADNPAGMNVTYVKESEYDREVRLFQPNYKTEITEGEYLSGLEWLNRNLIKQI
jgi:hypothetical protein